MTQIKQDSNDNRGSGNGSNNFPAKKDNMTKTVIIIVSVIVVGIALLVIFN